MPTSIYGALFSGTEPTRTQNYSVINVTGTTLTVTAATHSGTICTLNRATGIALTMPNATGTGNTYNFFIGTTITTTSVTTFTRGTAADVMSGICYMAKAATALTPFLSASNSNTVTLGVSSNTSGGTLGDWLQFVDVGTNQWWVMLLLAGAGTVVTPFSNT